MTRFGELSRCMRSEHENGANLTQPISTEQAIFAQAVELPGESERSAYLDAACGEDTALRQSVDELLRAFFAEVRNELKKVTWPSRDEVQATTVVVIITTIFFGFYLYGMDLAFSWLLSFILKK